jgi:spermidine/putrescine-binding protein
MNTSPTAFASSLLIAACAALAACGPIVSQANAQEQAHSTIASGAITSGDAKYFGDEFAAEQKTLVADSTTQAPTF